MTERPKESYLAWFREILANYKIIAAIIVLLGGYSVTNLYEDFGFGVPVKVPQESEAKWQPIGNQSVPIEVQQAIQALTNAVTDHTHPPPDLSHEHDPPPPHSHDTSHVHPFVASQPASHTHPEHSMEAAIAAHLGKSHIKDHKELHQ